MELLLLVFFCLLTGSEVTFGAENETTLITVKVGRDVTLPCSLREDITNKKFEWKRDGRQVFLYDDRDHSNIVNTGQDQQFIGRVEHFRDELKSGIASITISNIKVADSGDYTCEFPDLQPRQIFYVKLIVYVKAPKPSVEILELRGKSAVLQCEVRGAFPKPELHWEDEGRNKLPADKPQESERGGLYDVILQTTVTTTDIYRCVATQEEINHQTHAETFVSVPWLTPGEIVLIVISIIAAVAVLAVYRWRDRIMIFFLKVEASKPYVTKLDQTKRNAVLQGEVQGAFPKPELHWEDGAGNKLPAAEPLVIKRGGRYDIILITTVTKTGTYRCVATQKEINHQSHADRHVDISEKTVIRVDEGSDVILPCSLNTTKDITKELFVWMKDGRQVFLHHDGFVNDNSQHQQFRGRVSHFPDKLKSGNASIIIRNMKVDDSGEYTCEFRNLKPRQIFLIQLVVGGTTITMNEGSDVILPCSLNTKEDITNKKFVWKKGGRQVFLYDDSTVNSKTQDQQFISRVEHFPDELKSGNASITIRDMKAADSGVYTCEFPDLQPRQIFLIQLVVGEPEVIRVKEGSDATLPCSLREDITNKKFVWKKDDQKQVFLYDGGDCPNNVSTGQDQQFKGRVSHFLDKLKSGDASITITNMKVADSGDYTCEFPDLQPMQIFLIQLVVEPAAMTAPGKGSAQDPKKTEPAATTAPGKGSAQDPKKTETTLIIAEEGREVTLPCSLSSGQDITNKKFEWKKAGEQLFLYDKGQDKRIKGRFEHFTHGLKSGVTSIIIRNTKMTDSGLYTCEFPDLQPSQIFHIQLVVGPTVTGDEGREVTLPCSLSSRQDITSEKFVWKKAGLQVFLYDAGDHSNTGQHQRFNGRVSHFPDKLKSGNASITIRNMKLADTGEYTCEISSQTFYVKLVVLGGTTAQTTFGDETAGLLTGKTDGRDVEAGLPLMTADTPL